MKNFNKQQLKWLSSFGKNYTKRTKKISIKDFEQKYIEKYGITKSKINGKFYKYFKKNDIFFEPGCNIGSQLAILKKEGFNNLYGMDIQGNAINIGKKIRPFIKFKKGTSDKLPFNSNKFDIVMTNDFLIHLKKDNLLKTINEIYRVTKRYVWCFEYYSDRREMLNYRGNSNLMWKDNFKKYFQKKKFKIIKSVKIPYIDPKEKKNVDEMFLLKVIK